MISGQTKLCGLIGDPVAHSVSPMMHNAAFRELGLNYIYLPFRVIPGELGKAIDGMRALKIRGLNVTIPHKVNVIPFLDDLDSLAEQIGAVNTIVNDDGFLTGYNTDATGFVRALEEKGVELEGKEVAVLGAGGASRAISFILAEKGAHLTILNRLEELDWAQELAGRISPAFTREVPVFELNRENLAMVLDRAEVLVNATSVGMSPGSDVTPVAADLLKSDLVVFDVVYNPIKTRLLGEAAAAGATGIGGLNMLVWQGALSFEMWTGEPAPVDLMKRQATRLLAAQEG